MGLARARILMIPRRFLSKLVMVIVFAGYRQTLWIVQWVILWRCFINAKHFWVFLYQFVWPKIEVEFIIVLRYRMHLGRTDIIHVLTLFDLVIIGLLCDIIAKSAIVFHRPSIFWMLMNTHKITSHFVLLGADLDNIGLFASKYISEKQFTTFFIQIILLHQSLFRIYNCLILNQIVSLKILFEILAVVRFLWRSNKTRPLIFICKLHEAAPSILNTTPHIDRVIFDFVFLMFLILILQILETYVGDHDDKH